ncbi:hypothetical protein Ddye_016578 [Dipteronia dyeriana]|uniref:Helitron helicase-like domain-containing protein n=1 Tax=Dipteronia dyeriana TaxID=168575 RepID=A0AAD9U7H0_9ROSI|nr:hypothetical protein Ddye_016578 [Dipteronia dyeriana]
MLDEHNRLANVFHMARERFVEFYLRLVRIRLMTECSQSGGVYSLPNASEVATLIVGDLNDTNGNRDVVYDRSFGLRRIVELHPSFMTMQYPLLFPYGEDGFYVGILYHNNQCISRSGRLYQQYLVDTYTCIEEERLCWIRSNQPQFRAELYSGLRDAVLRGDTTQASIAKLIVLPSGFTGSPRYMAQYFQDVLAICRWAGNPGKQNKFTMYETEALLEALSKRIFPSDYGG